MAQCEHCQTRRKTSRLRLRLEALNAYGGKCSCCGEEDIRFLALDHINNDGAEARRKHGYWHRTQEKWIDARQIHRLRLEGYPDGLQVLCHNCNLAKGFYGACPHQAGDRMTISLLAEIPEVKPKKGRAPLLLQSRSSSGG